MGKSEFNKGTRDMADTEHGSMDTKEQEKTFNGFLKFSGYGMLGSLIFLFLLYLVNG